MHGRCTVSARSGFSQEDFISCGIPLQFVPEFASGHEGQAKLCLHRRIGVIQQIEQGGHGDGGLTGYLRRLSGLTGFLVKALLELLSQLFAGSLLDMGIGIDQHIRAGMACRALYGFHIAARDHQLVGGTGMPQPMKDDAGKFRVRVLPFEELFADEDRLHGLTVGQAQERSTVVVALWGTSLVGL